MDHQSTTAHTELKCIIYDEKMEPKALPLSLLEEITNGFSEEQVIGRGGFAVVYKGMLDNGAAIAVKKISHTYKYEEQFNREVECLLRVKHKNVVRFIGYCVDSQGKADSYEGKFVMSEVVQKSLCFEYVPRGSLDKYITDASCGLEWRTRYKIINGICDGLHFLHQNQVLHLDLKPPNILLDGNMLPKIADFGLSRRFGEKQSHAITTNIGGTMGYLAPEFDSHKITYRFDLYSLGVIIIEILTGKKGYEDVDNVLESWSNRLEESYRNIQLEQVRVCTEIGMECIESNPEKRPGSMQHIIARLHETGNTEVSIETRSSALQAETDFDVGYQSAPKATGGTSSETSSVSALVDEMSSIAVSATSSDRPRRTIAPKDPGEKNTDDFSYPGSSTSVSGRTMSALLPVALLMAVTKIRSIVADEALTGIIAKLSETITVLEYLLPVNLDKIRMQLTMMSKLITKIGIVYITDEVVRSWFGEVRNVAYHVEDVMDKYSYHALQFKEEGFLKKYLIKGTYYVIVFSEIAEEVFGVEKEIQEVLKMKDQWLQQSQLETNWLTEMERQRSQDSFPGLVKDEDLVGIEENRILLTKWLYSEELENSVITVSGMGGLGKSTLVSNVYEREKINFSAHAWIVVSQVYTVDTLLRKLLWKIGYTEQPLSAGIDKMDVHDLKKEVHQRLENRKYLIVLDDVWEQEVYFQMHDAFQNLQGSRIVITTRKDHVAEISSPTRHLKLQASSMPDAFDLFCRRAFYNKKNHMCPKDLEIVAADIVDLCHGLPQAIVKIGTKLSSRQGLDIWKQTYNQLQSELSDNDHAGSILNQSYHDLSEELKVCFLYCTLFSEDHPMSRESLVRLWVAEGFLQSTGKNTPEIVAEGNLLELIHRNMIQLVEYDERTRVNTCKMHAIVREQAISIAKEERFASAKDYGTMIQMDKNVRRLSLCGWRDNVALQLQLPLLRTVVAVGVISYSPGMLSSVLSESRYLTVLELQDCEVTEVPESIGSLFNLRYIGLRRTKVKSLPDCIEELSNLQTIDIKQTKIQKLPRGIIKIKKLRHLLADRYDDEQQTEFPCSIGVQAPENLSRLEELQTLETVHSSKDLAWQLRNLPQLESVWIDKISAADCVNLFTTLSDMPFLSSLFLSGNEENEALNLEAFKPRSTCLYRLIIRGQLANGIQNCPIFLGYGGNLTYLDLGWCYLGGDPLGMIATKLPNLRYLKLTNMHSANTLVISADYFPNLSKLVLQHMPDVIQLNIIDGALPSIEGLYIVSLSKLDKIPRGIESLSSLKKLWLLDLHRNFIGKWVANRMHNMMMHVPEVRI